jgi:hypothetical protein
MILKSKSYQIKVSRETKDLKMENSSRVQWKSKDIITIDHFTFRVMTNNDGKYIYFKEIRVNDTQELRCFKCSIMNLDRINISEDYEIIKERSVK